MQAKTYIKSKHRQLTDALRNRLVVENFSPGDRFLSVREIAEKYEVSLITSHKSIQELVVQNLLKVEPFKGCFVAKGVRALQAGARKPLIIVLTPESMSNHDIIPESFIRGIRERLPLARVVLEFLPMHETVKFLEAHVNAYTGEEMRAYVLRSVDASVKRFFADQKLMAVVTGNLEPDIDLPCIQRDERQIAYSVTRFLIGKGHRRIVYIEYDSNVAGIIDRCDGFRTAMLEGGVVTSLSDADRFIRRVPPFENETIAAFRETLDQPDRPSAIVFGLERQGAWGIRAAHQWQIKVPQDLALATLEGGVLTNHLVPRLTNIPRKDYETGAWTGTFLVRLLQGDDLPERLHKIPVSLEEHETT